VEGSVITGHHAGHCTSDNESSRQFPVNQYRQFQGKAAQLRASLHKWRPNVGAVMPAANPGSVGGQPLSGILLFDSSSPLTAARCRWPRLFKSKLIAA
jgi:hypothetical protein